MRKRILLIFLAIFLVLTLSSTKAYAETSAPNATSKPDQTSRPKVTSKPNTKSSSEKKEESSDAYVDDLLNDVDYSDIDKVIDEVMGEDKDFDFSGYVSKLAKGEEGLSITNVLKELMSAFFSEVLTNKTVLLQLLAIAVLAAVFTNFANIFKNNQVSETAFYITYLLMFSILTSSFFMATKVAANVLEALLSFMKVLMPTYMLSIAVSTGAKTSLFYYEATLATFTVIDFILMKMILPLINIYFVLSLANFVSKEDMLSKLAELIETIINWTLKTLLAFVIGFNAIQGLIVPMADKVKRSAFIKGTSVIPGIGNAINGVTETVLGASVVVKNAIGVAGLVVILTICIVPLVKLACFTLTYKLGSAIVQPISDKRIIGCLSTAANSAKLLLSTVFIALLLFMLSIALIAASTNLSM
ncbi:MAG: stage III sporulation protein AE [bacterium]|nr:stage III sporulation protein AE [bacterium]